MGVMAGSLIISGIGAYEKYEGAQAQTETQKAMVDVEQQQNVLRHQATHMQAQRMQMENLRNAQRARSLALAGAVTSGAQFGSGLSGGFGQISGAANTNALGINQNLQLSDQMFSLDTKLSGLKKQYAEQGGQISLGSGLMELGGTVSKYNPQITSLTKQAQETFSFQPFASSGYYG